MSGAITKTRMQTMFLSMRTLAKLFGRRIFFGPNILRLFVGSIENSSVFFQGFRRIAEIGSKIYCAAYHYQPNKRPTNWCPIPSPTRTQLLLDPKG